ncbi:MAG TPA: hypothetical protein RMG45_30665, partial [Polyangiaceae bacterium LLY-WYZ-15_(1-7)]|nr:hypothetical protein [Polyangiaceae bacterium LLY-WYZ-15_(1-7)]
QCATRSKERAARAALWGRAKANAYATLARLRDVFSADLAASRACWAAAPDLMPAVRCFVEDAGRFELPERLVAPYRDRIAVLEVARVTQAVVDVEGTELRLSDRRSDAVWLSP